jgi:hypothetical protein
MITFSVLSLCRKRSRSSHLAVSARTIITLVMAVWLTYGCAALIPPERQLDPEAEQTAARLRRINAELNRFKCVGKLTLVLPAQANQSFRAAMAGQLRQRLRIDMFAPFGGAAGTVSSDGEHLFVVMHPTREYHIKRFGSGSLRRFIQMDVTVEDLLEMMVGRIPMADGLFARTEQDDDGHDSYLVLVDHRNRIRQRITLDDSLMPVRSEWFDRSQQLDYTLAIVGRQVVAGFVLPERIDLASAQGGRLSVLLERYEANAQLDQKLFVPAKPSL